MTDPNPDVSLGHKGRTVQDMLNDLTPDEREIFDLVIGAAVDNVDLSAYDDLVERYDALPVNVKHVVDFMVGAAMAEDLAHADLDVNNFLAHFGVKGMRWGFRKTEGGAAPTGAARLSYSDRNTPEGRAAARAKVKGGGGTLADAHLAATKSTGHRVVNAVLGDKHYWKRQVQIVGGVVAGIALATVGVDAMPEGLMSSIGESVAGKGVGGEHLISPSNGKVPYLESNANIGRTLVGATILGATSVAGQVAGVTTQVTNVGRAIFGNKRIDESYAALGKNVTERQTTGSKQVQKILKKQGGLRGRNLKQAEPLDNFLSHHASVSMGLAHEAL